MSTKKLEIHVVEDHDEALRYIHRTIGSRRINFTNNCMIHFDAHPDLLWPNELKVFQLVLPEIVLHKVSIESWMLPLVAKGHVNKIVWFKPSWSTQIDDGCYEFVVGTLENTFDVRVSCPESYFLSESLYAPENMLVNTHPLKLFVVTLDADTDITQQRVQDVMKECYESDIILDLDLDYFSTKNPFRTTFPTTHDTLVRLYAYKKPDSEDPEILMASQVEHRTLIRSLEDQMYGETDPDLDPVTQNDIKFVKAEMHKHGVGDGGFQEQMDNAHNYACGADDKGDLPHKVNSDEEVKRMVDNVKLLLKDYKAPKVITMARSSVDGFCPAEQVDTIQYETLEMLTSLYPDNLIKQYY